MTVPMSTSFPSPLTISRNPIKFNEIQQFRACGLENVDVVITDSMPEEAYLEFFQQHQIRLIVADSKPTITSDDKGHAVSIAIPYGTYVVVESKTPHNMKTIKPFEVKIKENHPTEPQTWRVFLGPFNPM